GPNQDQGRISQKKPGGKSEKGIPLGRLALQERPKRGILVVSSNTWQTKARFRSGEALQGSSARFCYTWVISLHFSLTRKSGLAYDFRTAFFLNKASALLPLWIRSYPLWPPCRRICVLPRPGLRRRPQPNLPIAGQKHRIPPIYLRLTTSYRRDFSAPPTLSDPRRTI